MGRSSAEPAYEPLSVQNTIRRYHESLILFLRQRLRVPEDAADVAQETYIRMMQYQNSTRIRSPSSMLFRIAINVVNDLGRASSRAASPTIAGSKISSCPPISLPSSGS